MPYIKQDSRNLVDKYITDLVTEIRKHETDEVDGVVNYCLSRIVCDSFRPNSGWNYCFLNRAYGTFLSAAAEFLRRLVVPYEQKKSNNYNGGLDLPCYSEFNNGQILDVFNTINNTRNFPLTDGITFPNGDKAE